MLLLAGHICSLGLLLKEMFLHQVLVDLSTGPLVLCMLRAAGVLRIGDGRVFNDPSGGEVASEASVRLGGTWTSFGFWFFEVINYVVTPAERPAVQF